MPRPSGPLSAAFCRNVKEPGRYGDGRGSHGLYLRVYRLANGRLGRSWGQRLRIRGRVTCLGLGPYPVVSLAEAREKALENRRVAYRGGDPRRAEVPTFRELAEKVIALHAKSWKPGTYLPQAWRQTFRDYADPEIGDKPVGEITRSDVLAIVTPIWHERPAAARSVLQRIGIVLKYAVAQGLAERNVAEAAAIRAALPKANGGRKHHKALPHGKVAAALAKVRASRAQPATRLALEFLALTACRPGEVRGARWTEIDLEAGTWTIPAERMKAKRAHRVPLSGHALEVLAEARELSGGSELVFPSRTMGGPVCGRALTDVLRQVGTDATAHGLRSSFRDWCAESGVDRVLAEAALAHVVGGVEGAYQRSDLLERRREVMASWAQYATAERS